MTKEVRYYCDRCGKELGCIGFGGVRIRARLLDRPFTICRACDDEFCQWLHREGRFKE